MRDYINIGPVPPEEECAQVGSFDYNLKARKECERYIEVIRKKLGREPEGARLVTKSFPHDFGSYMEVVCYFDDKNRQSMNYAYACESDGPSTWDDVSNCSDS